MERIFQKYFAEEDFNKYYRKKSKNENAIYNEKLDKNLTSFINEDFKNSNNINYTETVDPEDRRFYENLFSQLVDQIDENSSDINLESNPRNVTNNLSLNKQLIGDICHYSDSAAGEVKDNFNPNLSSNLFGGKNVSFKKIFNNKSAKINSENLPVVNDNNNSNNNNRHFGRKYDLKKLNNQIIEKFGN